jgi:hypothetical protein
MPASRGFAAVVLTKNYFYLNNQQLAASAQASVGTRLT